MSAPELDVRRRKLPPPRRVPLGPVALNVDINTDRMKPKGKMMGPTRVETSHLVKRATPRRKMGTPQRVAKRTTPKPKASVVKAARTTPKPAPAPAPQTKKETRRASMEAVRIEIEQAQELVSQARLSVEQLEDDPSALELQGTLKEALATRTKERDEAQEALAKRTIERDEWKFHALTASKKQQQLLDTAEEQKAAWAHEKAQLILQIGNLKVEVSELKAQLEEQRATAAADSEPPESSDVPAPSPEKPSQDQPVTVPVVAEAAPVQPESVAEEEVVSSQQSTNEPHDVEPPTDVEPPAETEPSSASQVDTAATPSTERSATPPPTTAPVASSHGTSPLSSPVPSLTPSTSTTSPTPTAAAGLDCTTSPPDENFVPGAAFFSPAPAARSQHRPSVSPPDPLQKQPTSTVSASPSPPAQAQPATEAIDSRRLSAVKIQSLFRGHIERKAIREEKRLARIPLTSPSSAVKTKAPTRKSYKRVPGASFKDRMAQADIAEEKQATPFNKPFRARRTPVASSGARAQGAHRRGKSVHTLPSRPRRPASAIRRNRTQAHRAGSLKRTTKQAAKQAKEFTPSPVGSRTRPVRRTSHSRVPSDSSTSSASSSSSRRLSLSAPNSPQAKRVSAASDKAAAVDFLPCRTHTREVKELTPAQCKAVTSQLRQHRKLLSGIESNWSLRMKAITNIESMVRDEDKSVTFLPSFWTELELLRECIAVQLEDLRSSIIREACRLLIALAEWVGPSEYFASFLSKLLPVLFKRFYVTIKVISQGSHECAATMMKLANTSKCLKKLFRGLADPHAIVRQRCAEYLTAVIQKDKLQKEHEAVESARKAIRSKLVKHIEDSDKDVRAAMRTLYRAYATQWPGDADVLLSKFSSSVVRALKREA